mmetsp:Transcript_121054/g.376345  ORF Transcript_121054/g.376345 Transcript_121054/m.376345 type:complete len:214 (+) Transcript_121054:769-1410(+)
MAFFSRASASTHVATFFWYARFSSVRSFVSVFMFWSLTSRSSSVWATWALRPVPGVSMASSSSWTTPSSVEIWPFFLSSFSPFAERSSLHHWTFSSSASSSSARTWIIFLICSRTSVKGFLDSSRARILDRRREPLWPTALRSTSCASCSRASSWPADSWRCARTAPRWKNDVAEDLVASVPVKVAKASSDLRMETACVRAASSFVRSATRLS